MVGAACQESRVNRKGSESLLSVTLITHILCQNQQALKQASYWFALYFSVRFYLSLLFSQNDWPHNGLALAELGLPSLWSSMGLVNIKFTTISYLLMTLDILCV